MAAFVLRAMTLDDLEQVSQIDRLSFSLPWSQNTYAFEILENENAHMLVLAAPKAEAEEAHPAPKRLHALLHRLVRPPVRTATEQVIGLGGCWCSVGELHISTLAVHPDWRGQGLGEVLLSAMLRLGIARGAAESHLEVRVGNHAAISLYRKYEYEVLTRRPRYYNDNNEDAWLMQTRLDGGYPERLAQRVQALHARAAFIDWVNTAFLPNPGS